jgi:hypothetical protein
MLKPIQTLCLLCCTLISGLAQAHFFSETHSCKAPVKPQQFFSEQEQQQFEQAVEVYRVCLQGFIDKQNEAMKKHQNAAQQAADAWANYSETVLKPGQQATNQ